MIIQEFDLTIKHRSGRSNTNADALSRNPIPKDMSSVLAIQAIDDTPKFQEEQTKDSELAALIQYVKEGVVPEDPSG